MNCEKCQELLSDFLDNAMTDADHAAFSTHLEECLPCYHVHSELNSIVTFCRENRGEYDAPPNEQALWLRIRNTVEAESFATASSAEQNASRQVQRESWARRAMARSWQLSFAQMATAVIGIIVFASLATVIGLRGLKSGADSTSDRSATGSGPAVSLTSSKALETNENILQQQQIRYLTGVVEQRKAHWNPQVRADFERNLILLDQTVNESLEKLSAHPHDEVTEEMLNSAINDKVQLLREFSDL